MNSLRSWLEKQSKTRRRFVVFYGLLWWGGGTALGMSIWVATQGQLNAVSLVLIWVLFPAGGILWGLIMWSWSRQRSRPRA